MARIPLKSLSASAQKYVAAKKAAARAKAPTDFQRLKASARTREGSEKSRRAAEAFLDICEKGGIPKPQLEFKFHPSRQWRFDFAWPAAKLAMEVDGGVFISGRHGRGAGIRTDNEKLNSAAVMGWRVVKVFPEKVLMPETAQLVKRALRGWKLRAGV